MGVYTVLDLFSGYGGFQLGLRLAYPDDKFQTVAYVEWEPYAQEIIKARIRDGVVPGLDAPIWDDVKTFDGREWEGLVDLVVAGFPCQPHSFAGTRNVAKGKDDNRDLWPDTRRIIGEVRPRVGVILENVPGILSGADGRPGYAGRVLGDLASLRIDARWDCVSAASAGAPHKRLRWWVVGLADADNDGLFRADGNEAEPRGHGAHYGLPLRSYN